MFLILFSLLVFTANADSTNSRNFTFDLTAATSAFKHSWEECVGSGHASLTLRSDWRNHLSRASRELGFKRTRHHGLFDDDFSMYISKSQSSFVNLNSLIDFHLSLSMVPLFELSFMPSWLASNASQTVTHYKGITSPPKDYTEWGKLIEEMAQHLLDRYGEKICSTFLFEVWNEPNIGFWSGIPKQSTYFQLYKETADAFQRVSKVFQVGGPSTAGCPGWIKDLKNFTSMTNTTLDFVTCHSYGGGNDPSSVGDVNALVHSLPETKKLAGKLPVIVTEWSSSWSYTIDFHDDPGSAAFIAAAIAAADTFTDMMSYWTFSDVFEEGGILPGAFHGGFGLLNVYGTPKPAYRAFQLLFESGDERLAEILESSKDNTCPDGGVLAIKNTTALQLFLYNHQISGDNGTLCELTVKLNGCDSLENAKMTRIDELHTNPKKIFIEMGSPKYPSRNQLQKLENASVLNWTPLKLDPSTIITDQMFTLEVPAHGLAFVHVPLL